MQRFRFSPPGMRATSVRKDCRSCFDTWAHQSWIMLNLPKHLGSKHDFTCWLSSVYCYYLTNNALSLSTGRKRLPELHRRVALAPCSTAVGCG